MGIMVYSLLWVMQDFVHQQYIRVPCGSSKSRSDVFPQDPTKATGEAKVGT